MSSGLINAESTFSVPERLFLNVQSAHCSDDEMTFNSLIGNTLTDNVTKTYNKISCGLFKDI